MVRISAWAQHPKVADLTLALHNWPEYLSWLHPGTIIEGADLVSFVGQMSGLHNTGESTPKELHLSGAAVGSVFFFLVLDVVVHDLRLRHL